MAKEVRVNTYTTDFQKNPDITTFADGSYVIVWNSYYSGASSGLPATTYIAAQRFNADGRKIGSETIVFAGPDTSSKNPSVTTLTDGGYVVTWSFDDFDAILTNSSRVYAQVYNANGTVRVAAFRVDQTPDEAAGGATAFATAGGGFGITFNVYKSPYNDVYRRDYDAQGHALGAQALVDTVVNTNDQFFARSETLSDGHIIAAWSSVSTFTNGPGFLRNEIRGSILDANGQVLRADFHLTLDYGNMRLEAGGFDVGAMRGGGFVVSHLDIGLPGQPFAHTLYLDRFNAAGDAVGAPILAYSTAELIADSEVIQLASGEIAVIWLQSSPSVQNVGDDVMARLFSARGVALTDAFSVSVDRNLTDDQEAIRAVALPGGGFIVTYVSESIDGDQEGIAARTFGRGTSRNDVLTVDQSGTMAGLGGNDALTGNRKANMLAGGSGLDTLTGGGGADRFVFDRPSGVDHITDFSTIDVIVLKSNGFGGLGLGQLAKNAFKSLGAADADDRILHDQASGALFYDSNGSAAGGRVQFATVTPGLVLSEADFLVI